MFPLEKHPECSQHSKTSAAFSCGVTVAEAWGDKRLTFRGGYHPTPFGTPRPSRLGARAEWPARSTSSKVPVPKPACLHAPRPSPGHYRHFKEVHIIWIKQTEEHSFFFQILGQEHLTSKWVFSNPLSLWFAKQTQVYVHPQCHPAHTFYYTCIIFLAT